MALSHSPRAHSPGARTRTRTLELALVLTPKLKLAPIILAPHYTRTHYTRTDPRHPLGRGDAAHLVRVVPLEVIGHEARQTREAPAPAAAPARHAYTRCDTFVATHSGDTEGPVRGVYSVHGGCTGATS